MLPAASPTNCCKSRCLAGEADALQKNTSQTNSCSYGLKGNLQVHSCFSIAAESQIIVLNSSIHAPEIRLNEYLF